jgi:rod shape-determining protein MreD
MLPVLLLLGVMLEQIYAPFSYLPGGLTPDLALLAALFAGLVYAPWSAAALGFGVGVLQDTLASGWLGVGALTKGLTGLVWARLWRQVVGESPLLQLPLIAMLTAMDGAAWVGAALLFAPYPPAWETCLSLLGWQLLSNVTIGPPVLLLLAAAHRKLRRTKRSGRRRYASTLTFQPR